jgi:hypothetical protein
VVSPGNDCTGVKMEHRTGTPSRDAMDIATPLKETDGTTGPASLSAMRRSALAIFVFIFALPGGLLSAGLTRRRPKAFRP